MSDNRVLFVDRHVNYIQGLEERTAKSDVLYFTDHKRLSGVYWAVTSLALLGKEESLSRTHVLDYVLSCYHEDIPPGQQSPSALPKGASQQRTAVTATGAWRPHNSSDCSVRSSIAAFSGNTDQDPHLLYTVSGVQILALYDALDLIDKDAVAAFIASLQQDDGSFAGDKWGEIDSRFSYCSLLTLAILGRMDAIDVSKAVDYVVSCVNFDGGFGCIPGAESHAGQVFCCVGALKLCGALDRIDHELLGWWLCERQLECGGFNGRPDKKEDVCYSWWVLSSLAMLDKLSWIDRRKLQDFILRCQDEEEGGIADRPGDMPDVFHTFFGLAGLALLGRDDLKAMNPMYALPEHAVRGLPRIKNCCN